MFVSNTVNRQLWNYRFTFFYFLFSTRTYSAIVFFLIQLNCNLLFYFTDIINNEVPTADDDLQSKGNFRFLELKDSCYRQWAASLECLATGCRPRKSRAISRPTSFWEVRIPIPGKAVISRACTNWAFTSRGYSLCQYAANSKRAVLTFQYHLTLPNVTLAPLRNTIR